MHARFPFGLRLGGLSYSAGTPNRWKYNGKELHDELGLNWYDYGARMYEPSVGRWNGVDALAEVYGSWSPYNYVLNNPLWLIDPNGNEVTETDSSYLYTGEDAVNLYNSLKAASKASEEQQDQKEEGETEENCCPGMGIGAGIVRMENAKSIAKSTGDSYENAYQELSKAEAEAGIEGMIEGILLISGEYAWKLVFKGGRYIWRLVRVERVAARGAGNIAKTPVGRSGNVLNVFTKNSPTTINGTKFTGHALDQMQARGILSPSAVLDVVKNPARMFPGNTPGTTVFIRDNLKVITNKAGNIITVIPQ